MAKNPAGPAPAFTINTTSWQRQGNDQGVQNYAADGNAGQQVWDNPQNDPKFWTKRPAVAAQSQEYYGGTTPSADSSSQDSASNASGGGTGAFTYGGPRSQKTYNEFMGMTNEENPHWKQDMRARFQMGGGFNEPTTASWTNYKNAYNDPENENYYGDDKRKEFQDRYAFAQQFRPKSKFGGFV